MWGNGIDETWGQPDWGYGNGGSMCEEAGVTWLPGPLRLLPSHRPVTWVRVQGWLAETLGPRRSSVQATVNCG